MHENLDLGMEETSSLLRRSGELDRQNLRCPYFTAASGTHPDDLAFEAAAARRASSPMGRLVQEGADKTARRYRPWRSSFYKSCSDYVECPVLCSSAPWYGDLRRYHFIGLQDTVSQWRPGMSKAQGRGQGNCDGTIMSNCMLEGHRCATAHLHTVPCLECSSDFAEPVYGVCNARPSSAGTVCLSMTAQTMAR